MSFDPTGKSVDQILDYGAPGLEYWEHFLPLYTKAFGAPRLSLADLYARYDEQRGANLAEFDTARAELDKALTEAESRWTSHQSLTQSLPAAWTGATGAEALALVNSQLRQAREDLDMARAAFSAIAAALGPLHQAILAKAEVALALLEPTANGEGRLAIDGKTPEDIEDLVSDGTDPWLTTTFRPDVDRKLTTFTAACTTTAHTFESHYREILTAFAQVIDHPYPQPAPTLLPQPDPESTPNHPTPQPLPSRAAETGGAAQPYPQTWPTNAQAANPEPAQVQSPDRVQPTAVTPNPEASGVVSAEPAPSTEPAGVATPEAGGPAASAPDSTQPRTDQFATTLKDTLTQLETGLQQGISAAVEKLGTLTTPNPSASDDPKTAPDEAAADPKPEPDRPSGLNLPTGHLEFDLAGKHFVLERTPSGDLTAAVTDESGQTHTYKLTFDQNGNPTLAADTHDPTAPAGGDGPSPTPESAGYPGNSGDQAPATGHGSPDTPPQDGLPAREPPTDTAPGPSADSDPNSCTAPCPSDSEPPPTCTVPQPSLDNPVPPDVSPPTCGESKPGCPNEAGSNSPPGQGVESGVAPPAPPAVPDPSPDTVGLGAPPADPATPESAPGAPPNPVPALGSPDAPLEIPEGGVEIPEISPHTPSVVP